MLQLLKYTFPSFLEIKDNANVEEDKPESFNGLDYLLLGYNVLRGYPQAVGHDPGNIRPIKQGNCSAILQMS